MKNSDIKYSAVDADAINEMIDTEDSSSSKDDDSEKDKTESPLAKIFKSSLNNDQLDVSVHEFKTNDVIAVIKEDEQSKRMKEMSRMMGNADMGSMFNSNKLIVNENHPTIKKILNSKMKKLKTLCEHVYDLACIFSWIFKAKTKLQHFIKRSQKILEMLN